MKISIKRQDKFSQEFIEYLLTYIRTRLQNFLASEDLSEFNNEFNFNFNKYKLQIADSLTYNLNSSYITIFFNKAFKYDGVDCETLTNILSYGNRSVKGLSPIRELFEYVLYNIDELYEDWLNEY